jgi:TPR repeat protein
MNLRSFRLTFRRATVLAAIFSSLAFAAGTEAQQAATSTRWGPTPAEFSMLRGVRLLQRAGFPARFAEVLRAAESGDTLAMTLLGLAYYEGVGTKKDPKQAARWIDRAARMGEPRAMSTFGVLYVAGFGVEKDPAQSVAWTRKAMEAGNALAQLNMAARYTRGDGVPKSEATALRLVRAAASQGSDGGQYSLGLAHLDGSYGLAANDDSAAFWLRRASSQGYGPAFEALGWMRVVGRGVASDTAEALRLWNQGAEVGDAGSMFRLAIAHYRGSGVLGDYEVAARCHRACLHARGG